MNTKKYLIESKVPRTKYSKITNGSKKPGGNNQQNTGYVPPSSQKSGTDKSGN